MNLKLRDCIRVAGIALSAALICGVAQASSATASTSTGFCDRSKPITAEEQDRILRFSAVVRDELNESGIDAAIVSRSGLDLSRFDIRYSHASVMTRGDNGAWTARQLYYACDEAHPRIFDQGLAGFASGSDNPSVGYISIIVLPAGYAKTLRLTAQDKSQALGLLAETYSANAYPFSTRYQNCNQWVIELLAAAWGNPGEDGDSRSRAQQWLRETHYDPEPVNVTGFQVFASHFTPMLHLDDHPQIDRDAMRLKVSLPSTIETFVREYIPSSERIELCHNSKQIVAHHGWTPIADGCVAGEGDRIISLDN